MSPPTPSSSRSSPRGRRHTFALGGEQRQYDHEVLDVARVVRVVKGGRRFRFRASVIVGDRAGSVGFGIGKSRDVQQAIQKAQDHASKNMVRVTLKEESIPHIVKAKFNGAVVLLKPAKPGTGIIAGGTVRTVADLAGIKNLVSKTFGSSNRANNARATIKALGNIIVV
ncbi:MAG: 30S ribosomal protein S5 [Candidatus Andersenbacteria bacterium]